MADDPTGITLEHIAAEEAELLFARFDFDDAWRLGTMLVEAARSQQLPIAIDISRGGQQLFHAGLPGSAPDNDAWIARKIAAVLRFGRSSMALSLERKLDGRPLAQGSFVDPQRFAAAGGGFPIPRAGTATPAPFTGPRPPPADAH